MRDAGSGTTWCGWTRTTRHSTRLPPIRSLLYAGCGGVYPAVVTRGKRDLLRRLLDAGVKVPPTPGGCHTYLLEHPDMLKELLERGGLSPDYTDDTGSTFLHHLGYRDSRGCTMSHRTECAALLLAAGAALSPRNKYGVTPLECAAHHNVPDMVEFLQVSRRELDATPSSGGRLYRCRTRPRRRQDAMAAARRNVAISSIWNSAYRRCSSRGQRSRDCHALP